MAFSAAAPPRRGLRHDLLNWTEKVWKIAPRLCPRVLSANILLRYNAWPCQRRFGNRSSTCVFCDRGEDSIQHIVGCPALRTSAPQLSPYRTTSTNSTGCGPGTIDQLILHALAVHAIYSLRNALVHASSRGANLPLQLWEHLEDSADDQAQESSDQNDSEEADDDGFGVFGFAAAGGESGQNHDSENEDDE